MMTIVPAGSVGLHPTLLDLGNFDRSKIIAFDVSYHVDHRNKAPGPNTAYSLQHTCVPTMFMTWVKDVAVLPCKDGRPGEMALKAAIKIMFESTILRLTWRLGALWAIL